MSDQQQLSLKSDVHHPACNNTIPSKSRVNYAYKGNISSREAGLMVRDMVAAYEEKLKS